ncbi:hypothetical protein N9381_02215 [Paracoccaceae bacterium]|nr:hypothetical protein [Paracoccaceae bacterium]
MASSNTVQAETYKNARPLDVHTWSEYPEVNAFVNQLFELISSFKGNKNIGKKLVKVVLLDLYLAWSADPNLKIMFSRNNNSYQAKSRYNELHIGKKLIDLVDLLEAHGFIHQKKGFQDRIRNRGYQSRIWPSEKLISLFYEAKFNPFMINHKEDRECIVLRSEDGDDMPYEDKAKTKRMRSILTDYNQLLAETHIDIYDLDMPVIEIGEGSKSMRLQVNQQGKFVRRIFNRESFSKSGRFFGGWWQRCPKDYRKRITLDGIPTSEIDYSGLHIVLLYAQEGINYWTEVNEDPYVIHGKNDINPSIDLRKTAKLLLLMAINADTEATAFGAFRQQADHGSLDKKLNNKQLGLLLSHLKRRHVPIAHKLTSGAGIDLMYTDSKITEIIIQRFTQRGIPILTVHDSYIVPFGYDYLLKQTMEEAFEQVTGIAHPEVDHTQYYPHELHQAEGDVTIDETKSILCEHRSKRHLIDLELFKQFKQKPETPSWLPELQEFY